MAKEAARRSWPQLSLLTSGRASLLHQVELLSGFVCESSLRFVSRLIANVRYRRFCACQFGNALPFRTMTEFARPGWLGGRLLSTLLAFEWARELLLDDDGDDGNGG